MSHDKADTVAKEIIERALNLESKYVDLSGLNLTELPEKLGQLIFLEGLYLDHNELTELPEWLGNLTKLRDLRLSENRLTSVPDALCNLEELNELDLSNNRLTDLPSSLGQLKRLRRLSLAQNPLNPELAAADKEGLSYVKRYLHAGPREALYEAKLILIGEGEVGKSCLLSALRDKPFVEGLSTTHGIEIKPLRVTNAENGQEILLNGWDFGGQRVYRPTHQLFFSAPAVYLVVWKPREGPQQGFVKEWIKLVKHREPEAKILVVATHGGPQQRQPDIDRQEFWDLFGKDTVIGFYHVDSKEDKSGQRRGISELKSAIAAIASTLPEMGRPVPKRWQKVREALEQTKAAYLSLDELLEICRANQLDKEEAQLFLTIEHRLGHLIHYQHDPTLRDIVVLKPGWLATAISFVLDDEVTRSKNGLVRFSRLSQLWDDRTREEEYRYPTNLHPIFSRLMERFDLSYLVAEPSSRGNLDPQSLVAQLVPDTRPEKHLEGAWPSSLARGDIQQMQICRIVDAKDGQSATAEGLFYQLIVRLHKYSLGRVNHEHSIHWQRGLVLDDSYNGRALLEYIGNDIRITVRAPYPERFLAMLTSEVKYLVESFWEGLRCDVMVPCVEPCGKNAPGTGLFDAQSLMDSKHEGYSKFPCPVCNKWQNIDELLRNAPAVQRESTASIFAEFVEVKMELTKIRQQLVDRDEKFIGRFDQLDDHSRRTLSRVDKTYADFIQILTDEAKEGPRLFSLVPVQGNDFDLKKWIRAQFRLTLWCEHSHLPLPSLNPDNKKGVYEIELDREWFRKAAPYLKLLTGTLSMMLPVASSGIKLALDDKAYEAIEEQLDFSNSIIDATIRAALKVNEFIAPSESIALEYGEAIRAQGPTLRKLHALLREKDPSFGGLIRVMNRHQEFLWVHENFVSAY